MGELNGRTILITRGAEDAESWAAELAARGATPVVFSCIGAEPIRDASTAEMLADALDGAAWLALTSVRGVHGVAELVGARKVSAVKVAVVGAATAEAARQTLGHVDLIAEDGTSRSLGAGLARAIRDSLRTAGVRVVAAGAERPRADLETELEPLGVQVVRIPVYRTVPAPAQQPRENLAAHHIDDIVFASPSAVAGLLARAEVPSQARIFTIGPSTSEAVRNAGLEVAGEAVSRSLESLIEVMK